VLRRIALVVDDTRTVRSYIGAVLQEDGFETLEASNGVEAFTLVTRLDGRLDLIITDVEMPGGDGVSLARSVLARFPNIPILIVSGNFQPSPNLKVEFLEKPFRPTELLEVIRKMCPRLVSRGHRLLCTIGQPTSIRPRR
jgi:CheY-like chemotaxis protein